MMRFTLQTEPFSVLSIGYFPFPVFTVPTKERSTLVLAITFNPASSICASKTICNISNNMYLTKGAGIRLNVLYEQNL